MPQRRLLILVGMPGCGKSTVGREMARRLAYSFIDADQELERRCGTSITTIFELEGEAGFRQREALLLDELTARDETVLATGGGAILRGENRAAMHQRGVVIYLSATIDEILRRTLHDRSRPLLQVADPRRRLEELLAQREPLYREVAHLTFQSGSGNPRRLAERILSEARVQAALNAPGGPPLQ